MENYSDLPVAVDVYALGNQKKVKNLKRPKGLFGSNTKACSNPSRQEPIDLIRNADFSYLTGDKKKTAQKKMKQIVRFLEQGKTLNARKLIEDKETQKLKYTATGADGTIDERIWNLTGLTLTPEG